MLLFFLLVACDPETNRADDTGLDDTGDTGGVDTTPPEMASRNPGPDATGVAVDSDISVVWNEPIDGDVIGTVSFGPSSGGSTGFLLHFEGGDTLRLAPYADLVPGTSYTVSVGAGTSDLAGNLTTGDTSWSFTTVSAPVPVVSGSVPSSGATGVRTDIPTLTISLSQPVDPDSVTEDSVVLMGDTRAYGTLAVSGSTITLSPLYDLTPDTPYTLTVDADVAATNGETLGSDHTVSFRTVGWMQIDTMSPAANTTEVDIDTSLKITMSHTIDAASVDDETVEVTADTWVENAYRPKIEGTVSVSGKTLTFVPDGGRWQEYETGFTVKLRHDLRGTNGEVVQVEFSGRKFTTTFLDEGYYYAFHTEGADKASSLDTFAGSYGAHMSAGGTTGSQWYATPQGSWFGMRSRYGGSGMFLESSDGSALALLTAGTLGSLYTGQLWDFEAYNPRESGEIQRRGESPNSYRMQSYFQGDKQLKCDYDAGEGLRICKMQARNANIYGLFWIERLTAR